MGRWVWTVLLTALLGIPAAAQETRALAVFWNLENFFDYHDDGLSDADREFSPRGSRHWTKKRFQAKCQAIAKALFWISDAEGGRLPDVIGLAEVENRFVLRHLLEDTGLRKLDYRIAHFDSPDPRGIDVALLYRSDSWDLLSAKPCRVDSIRTRDILAARLAKRGGSDTLDFLICHLPSKYSGARASEQRREWAVERLRRAADSLAGCGNGQIVAMGDFNDTQDQPVFRGLEPRLLPVRPLASGERGTIRFEGVWERIDLVFASAPTAARCSTAVVEIPFLMTRDSSHPGDKPLRTYSGPRYLGGVSDHCPILLRIFEK